LWELLGSLINLHLTADQSKSLTLLFLILLLVIRGLVLRHYVPFSGWDGEKDEPDADDEEDAHELAEGLPVSVRTIFETLFEIVSPREVITSGFSIISSLFSIGGLMAIVVPAIRFVAATLGIYEIDAIVIGSMGLTIGFALFAFAALPRSFFGVVLAVFVILGLDWLTTAVMGPAS
jgi:hypothetical protein